MIVNIKCRDGVTQGFHVSSKNLKKLRAKYGDRFNDNGAGEENQQAD
jgi:hypothetical protein